MDICKLTGVSSATVSRVINGSPLVVEATRRKVQKAINELGYHPNYAARMLARDRTEMVAVIIPGMGRDYFMEVLSAVDRVTAGQRHHVMIALSHNMKDEKDLIMQYVNERRADGLIVMALSSGYDAVIRKAGSSGVPVMVIGRRIKAPNVGSVSIDNVHGAEQMIEHLYAQGCRRPAIIAGPSDNTDSQQRLEGALQTAARLGLDIPEASIWKGNFVAGGAYELVKDELVRGKVRPDAIFALNDDMALGARAAVHELGLRIPQDIAVAGFDDVPAMHHVGMTSVLNPMGDQGRLAAEMMMARLHGDTNALNHVVLPTNLVVRGSTLRQKV